MGKKKIDVTQESFVSSTEEVKEELAADVAAEREGTDDGGLAEGDPAEGPEGGEPNSAETTPAVPVELMHEGDPCIHCGVAHDDVEPGACTARITSPFTSDGNQPTSYVSRDPDKISATFTRDLPVPVPDEELAELANRMSHTHGIWCKAKLDAKAAAKGFKGITDRAEDEMVELAAIIVAGTEERPVTCRWEFDYAAGVKKLRRMDNWQIVTEETLQGDELHLSFNFQQQSEDNVAKFFEKPEEVQTPLTDDPQDDICDACNLPITEGQENVGHDCNLHKECAEKAEPSILTEDQVDTINSKLAEAAAENVGEVAEPKVLGPHACKVCGFDTDSHIYLVRHLRDTHGMKLSEYKTQFPS